MAPSHYLNQCRLIINGVLRHSLKINFTRSAQGINLWNDFKNTFAKSFTHFSGANELFLPSITEYSIQMTITKVDKLVFRSTTQSAHIMTGYPHGPAWVESHCNAVWYKMILCAAWEWGMDSISHYELTKDSPYLTMDLLNSHDTNNEWYLNGSMQKTHNFIANALELCLFCIKPLIYMMFLLSWNTNSVSARNRTQLKMLINMARLGQLLNPVSLIKRYENTLHTYGQPPYWVCHWAFNKKCPKKTKIEWHIQWDGDNLSTSDLTLATSMRKDLHYHNLCCFSLEE